jgi:REP element-mobilizing transposase RayT
MPVRKRLDLEGPSIAFITTTVQEWRPIFERRVLAIAALTQLRETVGFHDLQLYAYVLMPSHLHLLARFPEISDLSRIIQGFKSLTARRIYSELLPREKDFFERRGCYRFWRPRFDDLIITSTRQFKIKAAYIHNNPVKAGIVAQAEDFEFSSARQWTTGETGWIRTQECPYWN